jgi:ATP-binding cassette subfamily F protein 3
MINLNQVSLRRGRKLLFENVSFQVHAGQRLGLIGANGSGKTSLFSMLLGELEPDGGELQLIHEHEIAHVAQESPNATMSALDFVMDGDHELREVQAAIAARESREDVKGEAGAELHTLYEKLETIDGYTAEARASRLLHGLGFSGDSLQKAVREFSGGWRMRLNLAQSLMCRSDILLLDEPTNHLDLPAILWLEHWLKRYQGILLLISHDRDFLDGVCTRIANIENRQIRLYSGNYSQFEKQRTEQLAQQQAMHKRQQKEVKHIQAYVDRFRYKASKARQAQSRLKMLERMTLIAPAHVDSPFRFHFMAPKNQPQHLLKLEEVDVGYDKSGKEKPVLVDINLSLIAGDRIGLLGVNGAGKSTLVKALADGSTLLKGERILSRETRISYFAQHQLDQLNPDASPIDHLREGSPDERESDLRDYLGRFGFRGERIFDPVAPFSGGEKARLVLALIIRQQPNLLLLDEPTNHLDLEMRQALSMALVEYSGALVVISHDRHLLRSVCDELLVINNGTIENFNQAVDDYPAWLKEQQVRANTDAPTRTTAKSTDKQPGKKQARQLEAQRRQRLKPLLDRVRDVEKNLATNRMELEMLEKRLADATLYTDPGRKEELTDLIRQQGSIKTALESLEWEWLEASEALENT